MSVLKNIKGTIQSVQHDLSTSIKSLTISPKDKNVQRKSSVSKYRSTKVEGVNLDAGADLLNKYQENWSDLHQQSEENANKAENLAIVIGSLFVKYDRESESFSRLSAESESLPTVIQQLQDLTNQIARVEELCEQVEAAEVQLENICEAEEFRRAQIAHHQQLASYRERRHAAAEKYKVGLAQEHAKKAKLRDSKRQAQLKERQSIFQEAFDKDLNYYRTFGKTERQPSVENDPGSLELGDIPIDEDQSALDSFLASSDVTPSSDRPPVLTEDEMPDEEDSGVIYDGSDSPECSPQNISTEKKIEDQNTKGSNSGRIETETVRGSNSDPADGKGDNSNAGSEHTGNNSGAAKGNDVEEMHEIESESNAKNQDDENVEQNEKAENCANNNSEESTNLENTDFGANEADIAQKENIMEVADGAENDSGSLQSESVETGELNSEPKSEVEKEKS